MKHTGSTLFFLALTALPLSGGAQVGSSAPNFTVTGTHGNTHTLYNLLDSCKVVVLDFFYTTCIPCQFYTPQVNLAYEKYGCNTETVFFMAIDYQDTNAEVLAYDQQYGIEYPSVSGLNGGGNAVVAQYNIIGFPTFYVIDSSRTIVQEIDPPTLQVFDFRFQQLGIQPVPCAVSGTTELSGDYSLEIFPNPLTGNRLHVRLPDVASGACKYEVLDFSGSVVGAGQLHADKGNPAAIEVNDLPAGIYLVKIGTLNSRSLFSGLFTKQ
jgi:thiol-disulfide isomerase/thioredoxin